MGEVAYFIIYFAFECCFDIYRTHAFLYHNRVRQHSGNANFSGIIFFLLLVSQCVYITPKLKQVKVIFM